MAPLTVNPTGELVCWLGKDTGFAGDIYYAGKSPEFGVYEKKQIKMKIVIASEWSFHADAAPLWHNTRRFNLESYHTSDPRNWWRALTDVCVEAGRILSMGSSVLLVPAKRSPTAERQAPHVMTCLLGKLFGAKPSDVLEKIKWGDSTTPAPGQERRTRTLLNEVYLPDHNTTAEEIFHVRNQVRPQTM